MTQAPPQPETILLIETYWTDKRRAYTVRLLIGDNPVAVLDTKAALRHGAAVLAVAQHAEHDAAILRQFTRKLEVPLKEGARCISELRRKRKAPSKLDTHPLVLTPGIGESELNPFVDIHLMGQHVGQWDMPSARLHARRILESAERAKLDTVYRRYMTDTIGLDEARASQAVYDLRHFTDSDLDKEPGDTP